MNAFKVAGVAGAFFVGLYLYDAHLCRRIQNELSRLCVMQSEATELLANASEKRYFTVWSTEKEIFQQVCEQVNRCIDNRVCYNKNVPILRVFLAPRPLDKTLDSFFWRLACEQDGDFYETFLRFYTRHIPNSIGSVVFQEILTRK